jgi:hypothetical protein
MTNEQPATVEALKTTYIGLLDQASDLAKHSIESAKKLTTAAMDAQKEAFDSITENPVYSPLKNVANIGMGYADVYANRLSEGLEVAQKTGDVITEIALSWQKVALEAQKNIFTAYANYFAQFRA